MPTADEQVIVEGQRALSVAVVDGDFIYDGGTTDVQCIVNDNGTARRAMKVALVGPGGGAKQEFVLALPETGESGVLYYVNTGRTREGYTIWQEFIWYNNAWAASGAFDSSIDPEHLLYENNFNASTNTLTLEKNS